jgi:hypothetical protein
VNAIMPRQCDAMLPAGQGGKCEAEDVFLQFIAGNTNFGGDSSRSHGTKPQPYRKPMTWLPNGSLTENQKLE